ncbi:MAG: hypothetical protein J2P27_11870 [Actinobacteria bacterium]|nr:hypothetical protein [Actinomycetota bacterium]
MTQKTRRAEAYGSARIALSTSAANGLMPVEDPHRPITFARWTSYAAR